MSFKDKLIEYGSWTGAGFAATQVVDFLTPFSMSWQENGLAGVALAVGVAAGKVINRNGGNAGDIGQNLANEAVRRRGLRRNR